MTACPASERLSAFLDGDLPPAESEMVRAHGAGCPRCAAAMVELSALVHAARGLEAPEPPPTLWRAVALSLDALQARERSTWLAWRPFAVGALAGASALALALFVLPTARGRFATSVEPRPQEVPPAAVSDPLLDEAEAEFGRAAAAYERSIEKLRTLLAGAEKGWSPDERARIAERLTRLDDAIARSREVAHRTPGDSAGNEQLFAAYQQKITFLAAAVHRGDEWSERTP